MILGTVGGFGAASVSEISFATSQAGRLASPSGGPTAPGPGGQAGAVFVYDPNASAFVMFGYGGASHSLPETWEWKSGQWAELTLTTEPCGRQYETATYDPAIGGVLMFGGEGCGPFGYSGLNDTWLFKSGSWTDLTPNLTGHASPPDAYRASLTYDARDGYALLYGGYTSTLGYENETWAFANNTWFIPHCAAKGCIAPFPRDGASLTYDPALGKAVLYGGYACLPHAYCGPTNQTYLYSNGVWSRLRIPSGSPQADDLYLQSSAWDPSSQCIVRYGGINGYAIPSDRTWRFVNSTWHRLYPNTTPPHLFGGELAYDPANGDLILFGGELYSSGYSDHLWEFAHGNWTRR